MGCFTHGPDIASRVSSAILFVDDLEKHIMNSFTGSRCLISAGLLGVALISGAALADDGMVSDSPAAHAQHSLVNDSGVRRSEAQYMIPDVTLLRDDGKPVNLRAELDDGRPLVVNFIYTSCTTICPMNSQVFEQFQGDLGVERKSVHLVSISIDPEQDTPAHLRKYAAQFHAQRGWDHYTGKLTDIVAVQQAFGAYRGDKMSHTPLTLMRSSPGKPWVRFDGFARADDLMAERKQWEVSPASLVAR
jgi:protein SCO1